jgi:signal transduction histidine kinase
MFRRYPPQRPGWWPHDAQWPPPRPQWSRTRRHFASRFFIAIGLLLFFTCAGVVYITTFILDQLGLQQAPTFIPRPGLIFLAFFILFGLLMAGRSLRRMARPVGEVIEAANRVAEGDYSGRVEEHGAPPEVHLARSFNTMVARLQDHEQQRRALLADITHELRTPLTIIQGNVEGLLEGIYPADEAHFRAILQQTQQMDRLIGDLRTLSLAESGMLKLEKQATDLGELIRGTLAGFRDRAVQNGIRLEAQVEPDLPQPEIDPVRMGEVLANLITNALRYSPQGGAIEVFCRMETPDRTQLVLAVRDEGPGIPPEDLPHVFERFYKSADSGGSGLGLAIAKNLVTLHGGTIDAESPPGGGTTMTIRLPLN